MLDKKTGRCRRALFVIDKQQRVRHVTINTDSIARSVDEIFRIVRGLIAVDKTGKVVPCGI